MLWIVLAAQLSLPVALGLRFPDVRAVFSSDDMPAYVQMEGITRFVPTRTTVGPDGTPQDCTVERSSGDSKLDAYTCSIIMHRAKFQAAKWVDGSPAFGVVRAPVTWAIGQEPPENKVQRAYPADMDLAVDRLPAGAGRQTGLRLMIAVDENGRLVGCSQAPPVSERDHTKTFPQLVSIACQRMVSQYTAIPAKDASGKPVHSVQTASVVFIAGK
jgi:hypothetical protein